LNLWSRAVCDLRIHLLISRIFFNLLDCGPCFDVRVGCIGVVVTLIVVSIAIVVVAIVIAAAIAIAVAIVVTVAMVFVSSGWTLAFLAASFGPGLTVANALAACRASWGCQRPRPPRLVGLQTPSLASGQEGISVERMGAGAWQWRSLSAA